MKQKILSFILSGTHRHDAKQQKACARYRAGRAGTRAVFKRHGSIGTFVGR